MQGHWEFEYPAIRIQLFSDTYEPVLIFNIDNKVLFVVILFNYFDPLFYVYNYKTFHKVYKK